MNALSVQGLYAASYAPVEALDPALDAEMAVRSRDWRVVRGMSGGWCGTVADPLMARLAQLSPAMQREVATRAIEWGVKRGVADWIEQAEHGMGQLSQDAITNAVAVAVQRALEPMMPALKAQLLAIAEPAAKKAAEVVGPVIEEKLRDYGPTLAAITGVVAAVLSIVGMLLLGGYIVRKVG